MKHLEHKGYTGSIEYSKEDDSSTNLMVTCNLFIYS